MPIVEIDRSKPFTKETGFTILSIVGIEPDVLRELMLPEDYAEFEAWERKALSEPCGLENESDL